MTGNNMGKKTILITGINGYLGSSLAKTLAAEFNIVGLEYRVEHLYRLEKHNFKVYPSEEGIPDSLFKENKIEIIIHVATFYGKNEDIAKMAKANLFLPLELLNKAITYNCNLFINTDTVLARFTNIYSLTKRQFREWLFIRSNEIKIINMQLEHFYGPDANQTNFISAMIQKLNQNIPRIDLTNGEQCRDFIYIDDVVSAYHKVIKEAHTIPEKFKTYQVCSGESISIKNLMITLKEITGSHSILDFGAIPYRENELMEPFSNNEELRKLDWKPRVSLKQGLNKLI